MGQEQSRRVRYAVVGLGWFGQAAVLPAFQNAKGNSELRAIVSDDPKKREELSGEYNVPACSYQDYDALLASGTIDAVYLVLPNSLHHDYTLRAARQGVHVLCEKPLAGSSSEAKEMIDACQRANVRLMTAYRLHFEPANLSVVSLIDQGAIGEPRLFTATHTNNVKPGNTRLEGNLAGGPLRDIGIYCINAARYVFRSEPTEVTAFAASSDDPRFKEVPEMVSAVLRFPRDRLATFNCGFGEATVSRYSVIGTEGEIGMESGFSFNSPITRTIQKGEQNESKTFPLGDQVAPEIVYFSGCVLKGRDPEPSGLEGLIDMEIMEAIEQSAREGKSVALDLPEKVRRPDRNQSRTKPAVEEPELVHADTPK
ncbi:MAG: Gfo/Idh/MocA family oxidoreductase [Planctomycetaceae bacterium]|nr:Gfo/Idh/MocA family oxidoreductase [Planctomycetaceae bacterium]